LKHVWKQIVKLPVLTILAGMHSLVVFIEMPEKTYATKQSNIK
jgi:hypothetical protein